MRCNPIFQNVITQFSFNHRPFCLPLFPKGTLFRCCFDQFCQVNVIGKASKILCKDLHIEIDSYTTRVSKTCQIGRTIRSNMGDTFTQPKHVTISTTSIINGSKRTGICLTNWWISVKSFFVPLFVKLACDSRSAIAWFCKNEPNFSPKKGTNS